MPVVRDIDKLKSLAIDNVYILTERPKQLELITLNWLNRNFVPIKRNQVVYSSIKRYDCRLLGITKHIDIKFENEDWYKFDNIEPIEWTSNE